MIVPANGYRAGLIVGRTRPLITLTKVWKALVPGLILFLKDVAPLDMDDPKDPTNVDFLNDEGCKKMQNTKPVEDISASHAGIMG